MIWWASINKCLYTELIRCWLQPHIYCGHINVVSVVSAEVPFTFAGCPRAFKEHFLHGFMSEENLPCLFWWWHIWMGHFSMVALSTIRVIQSSNKRCLMSRTYDLVPHSTSVSFYGRWNFCYLLHCPLPHPFWHR